MYAADPPLSEMSRAAASRRATGTASARRQHDRRIAQQLLTERARTLQVLPTHVDLGEQGRERPLRAIDHLPNLSRDVDEGPEPDFRLHVANGSASRRPDVDG